jgi:transglutaminase 1
VFMPETRLLDEYVLNDVGKVWVGSTSTARGREWVFGQFDAVVLPAARLVLERTGLSGWDLGNPVRLTRAFSKLVSEGEGGLLQKS